VRKKKNLRAKLMGSFSIKHGRDENSVARPKIIDPVERGVVLGNDKDHVLAILHGYTNQPVVEEGQVGLADNADDEGAISGDEGESLLKCVVIPFGSRG